MVLSGLVFTAALALSGCASKLPQEIREAPQDNPRVSQVRGDPDAFAGRQVRWGGTIAGTENRPKETCLEIVDRRLQEDGKPYEEDASQGRFLACLDGFLDPAIYAEGRRITVSGRIEGGRQGKIGQFDYLYPVVRVSEHYLWPLEPQGPMYVEPDPFWYGPPWGPYWRPWYGHPWYGYPYYW